LALKLQSCVLGLKLEKSCRKIFLYEKRAKKTLMKLMAGVTNILQAASWCKNGLNFFSLHTARVRMFFAK
jgi:hypothetical protein